MLVIRKKVIYYFENDPNSERKKEAVMTATARDASLSLTPLEIHDAAKSSRTCIDGVHPYPPRRSTNNYQDGTDGHDDGEVNVYNCKQIFNQYCSIALGASIQPKKVLYKYQWDGDRKILSMIRFPTPHGWQSIDERHYMSFWNGVNMEEVFHEDRVKRKSASEKEEMSFVYIVVVDLRERGYLNNHNKPNPSIKLETKRRCVLSDDWSSTAISIKNTVFQSYR